jgi:hypothetical protein
MECCITPGVNKLLDRLNKAPLCSTCCVLCSTCCVESDHSKSQSKKSLPPPTIMSCKLFSNHVAGHSFKYLCCISRSSMSLKYFCFLCPNCPPGSCIHVLLASLHSLCIDSLLSANMCINHIFSSVQRVSCARHNMASRS